MCCIDGSQNSLRALNSAKHMLNPSTNDILLIIHCCSKHSPNQSSNKSNEAAHGDILFTSAHALQDEAMKRIKDDPTVTVDMNNIKYMNIDITDDIDIRDKLIELIHEYSIDYLFIGRRGYSRANKLYIGSTAHYMLHHAPVNVVLVK